MIGAPNNSAVEAFLGIGALSSPFLEAMNGAWFISGLCFLLVLLFYIWWAVHRRVPLLTYGDLPGAFALTLYFAGETVVRFWLWLWRKQINEEISTAWMDNIPVVPVGGVIALIGLLWMIRRFTPGGSGRLSVAVSAVAILAFVFLA